MTMSIVSSRHSRIARLDGYSLLCMTMKSVDATKFSNDVKGEKKFTDDFIGFLKTKGIKVYEFEDKDPHFIVDPKYDDSGEYITGTGEYVGYYFIPNNKLKIEGHGEKEKQVANAIKEYVEKPTVAPSPPPGPPPPGPPPPGPPPPLSRLRGRIGHAIKLDKMLNPEKEEGGRKKSKKTRKPKRKSKSTRRR